MDEITQVGIQWVPNDIKKEFGNSAFLINAALDFLYGIEKIVNEYQHCEKMLSSFSINLSSIVQVMHQSKEGLKMLIQKQYSFEEKVNSFLGRTINFAWADNKGKILFADQITAQEIYTSASFATGKKGSALGKINFNKKLQEKAEMLPSFVEKELQQTIDRRMRSHQSLYQTVLSRWNDNRRKNNPWHEQHNQTVYWQHPPLGADNFNHYKWSWSYPVNKGNISEGYVNFIFNSVENLTNNEFGIGTFMMQEVQKQDRIPGIVKGDVVIQNANGNIHIAVKSSTFHTAAIGPYLTLAYQIIGFYNQLENLTIDNVQVLLDNLSQYKPKILQASKEQVQEILEQILKSTGAIIS